MTSRVVHCLPSQAEPALRLAQALSSPREIISVRQFPDGESLVRTSPHEGTAIVYCSLNNPNGKLIHLLLAASSLRDGGAGRIVLVAPYMCYMRQDVAFLWGEAVSQKVIARLLSEAFDRILTVDPHLHRTRELSDVFSTQCDGISAAPLIGETIAKERNAGHTILIGPDSESRPWVEAAAGNFPYLVGRKQRSGDREIKIEIDNLSSVSGKTAIILDDLVSSGTTACATTKLLKQSGAASVEVFAVHALSSAADLDAMRRAGVSRLQSTDSIIHPTNTLCLAPLLARELMAE